MTRPIFRRRNYFINRDFQVGFTIKFLIVIVIESILAIGLFMYLSRGTLTTGFIGADFRIARTSEFFLPTLLVSNLIIIVITAVIGIAVLIYMSHRIAGPLFRFEKILENVGRGDLTQRFKLRDNDQLSELSESITELTTTMDNRVSDIKFRTHELSGLLRGIKTSTPSGQSDSKDLENLLREVSENVQALEEVVNYFKTSENQ
ncbi:MAG TPA: methyl-accepting chemotaxis protein [Nitrospirota bacterium]|nr:methyl-accepting chemotaxis protein [Nitrospirota bacterium]